MWTNNQTLPEGKLKIKTNISSRRIPGALIFLHKTLEVNGQKVKQPSLSDYALMDEELFKKEK